MNQYVYNAESHHNFHCSQVIENSYNIKLLARVSTAIKFSPSYTIYETVIIHVLNNIILHREKTQFPNTKTQIRNKKRINKSVLTSKFKN